MENIWISIALSLLTGVVSSSLVVLYFELRHQKMHALSRAHILERFSRELFHILTAVRIASNLKLKNTATSKAEMVKELEQILGRNTLTILLGRISNLSPKQHQVLLNELILAHSSLSVLFSQSIGHKTLEDRIAASMAETQEWIDSVLIYYTTYPEIIDGTADQTIHMVWMTSVFNLVENSFAILNDVVKAQTLSEGALRWGSRSSKHGS
ncbi:MAG: hypothetical protein NTZ13_05085 [Candidatus Parcubacteria bacterium]|nr:hypothetical protein [Candidatus Parcubacteria bacterium]